jgi:hypothetical protein
MVYDKFNFNKVKLAKNAWFEWKEMLKNREKSGSLKFRWGTFVARITVPGLRRHVIRVTDTYTQMQFIEACGSQVHSCERIR